MPHFPPVCVCATSFSVCVPCQLRRGFNTCNAIKKSPLSIQFPVVQASLKQHFIEFFLPPPLTAALNFSTQEPLLLSHANTFYTWIGRKIKSLFFPPPSTDQLTPGGALSWKRSLAVELCDRWVTCGWNWEWSMGFICLTWSWRVMGGGGGGGGEGGDKIMSPWKVVECRQEPEMTPCNKSY